MKITVATDRPNKRYKVRVSDGDLANTHDRDYVWGDCDEWTIYPQRARADAWAYAEHLSKKLDCRWHVVGR
jgi:hypothetical protein